MVPWEGVAGGGEGVASLRALMFARMGGNNKKSQMSSSSFYDPLMFSESP